MNVRILHSITVPMMVAAVSGFLVQREPRVFLIGDSTMADKPLIGSPERGWGQFIPEFFHPGPVFENHARNGRSTKSFIAEGRWDVVRERLNPGDYVMIQFGHNDAKKEDATRYADAHTDYKDNLLRFIREARAKEATPILITPVCRRRFDAAGKFYDVHGDYPQVVRELAAQEQVAMVDLNKKSFALFESLGVKGSEQLFIRADSGVFSAMPYGKKDDTHFVARGAIEVARLVAEDLRQPGMPLAAYLKEQHVVSFEGAGQMVLIDGLQEAGVDRLCSLISVRGADIDTMSTQSDARKLWHASIYIAMPEGAVSESGTLTTEEGMRSVADWVSAGGMLVLVGNQEGLSGRLQLLAGRFGGATTGKPQPVGKGSVVVIDGAMLNAGTSDMIGSLVYGMLFRDETVH